MRANPVSSLDGEGAEQQGTPWGNGVDSSLAVEEGPELL